jgi:hypothetical protein
MNRSLGNILVNTNTPSLGSLAVLLIGQLNVSSSLGLGTLTNGVLVVVENLEVVAKGVLDGIQEGRNGTVTGTLELDSLALDGQSSGQLSLLLGLVGHLKVVQLVLALLLLKHAVLSLKEIHQLLGRQLLSNHLGLLLDHLGEGNLQASGQIELQRSQNDPGGSSLAGLRIDSNDCLVGSANVLGVKRQVGDLPLSLALGHLILDVFDSSKALLDGVLVRAGEGTHHQLAAVGSSGVHGDLVASLHNVDDRGDVGEVNLGMHALGVQIQTQSDEVDVSGSLAVAKQTALDSVGSGHLAQLGSSHGTTSVVVGVQRNANLLPLGNVGGKVLNLVGVDVGGGHFDGGGEVENDGVLLGGAPGGLHGLTDLNGVVHVGVGEGLGGELKAPGGLFALGVVRVLGQGSHVLGACHGLGQGLFSRMVEDNVPEALGGGEVDVDDGLVGALDGLDGSGDEILSARSQHLDPHVFGGGVAGKAGEVKVHLRGGRERHLDLLVANVDNLLEVLLLLRHGHGIRQRLVAVPQVRRQPPRGLLQRFRRPLPVGQIDRGERLVFGGGIGQVGHSVMCGCLSGVGHDRCQKRLWYIYMKMCHRKLYCPGT